MIFIDDIDDQNSSLIVKCFRHYLILFYGFRFAPEIRIISFFGYKPLLYSNEQAKTVILYTVCASTDMVAF